MLTIIPVPAFKDNYIWTLQSKETRMVWIVDPGDAKVVVKYLTQHNLLLEGILVTHHHRDHAGGVAELRARYPTVEIYGADPLKVPEITHRVTDGDRIHLKSFEKYGDVLSIPGHTLDHTAFLLEGALFCGDTLFACGCGRIFEGTPSMMYHSLNKIKRLPGNTRIYCGHEYTAANIAFANMVDPANLALQKRAERVSALTATHRCTLPSLLAEECLSNPFLRCDTHEIQIAVARHCERSIQPPIETFAALREWKNKIK